MTTELPLLRLLCHPYTYPDNNLPPPPRSGVFRAAPVQLFAGQSGAGRPVRVAALGRRLPLGRHGGIQPHHLRCRPDDSPAKCSLHALSRRLQSVRGHHGIQNTQVGGRNSTVIWFLVEWIDRLAISHVTVRRRRFVPDNGHHPI